MGTIFNLDFYAKDSAEAVLISKKVFKKLDELNMILSDYREDSEINRLCQTSGTNQSIKVSDDLWEILSLAVEAHKQSKGNFDITIGPLTQLWRRMKRQKQLPKNQHIDEARAKIGIENIILNTDNQSVMLSKKGMRIDFGGIGKGFAADKMMMVLKENNIDSAMIEAGGNILVSAGKWEIIINQKKYFLSNCGISTSGDLYQFVEINGIKYSHILDPKTGIGFTQQRQITIIAKDGTNSDWLSTAIYLMNRKEGLKLAKKLKVRVL